MDLVTFTEKILNEKLHFLCIEKLVACALGKWCLDYSNLQERRNISELHMIAGGHLFSVYCLGNEYT